MFCRVCGSQINENAEVCVKCGCRPWDGKQYCQECGAITRAEQEFCIKCGCGLVNQNPKFGFVYGQSGNINSDFAGLSAYYQEEFTKIKNSGERYKGKFNWCAFLFGSFWAFSKGCWLSGIVTLVISFFTAGLGAFVLWIIYGFRGNYVFYNLYVKNKQIPL